MRPHLVPTLCLGLCLVVGGCADDDAAAPATTRVAATVTAPTAPPAPTATPSAPPLTTTTSTAAVPGTATSTTTAAAVDPQLRAALDAVEATGATAVVAVSRQGGPVQVFEFGAYDDDGIDADDVLVDVGSITKTVTGVLLARAVDDGVIALDDTLGDLLASVPDDKAGITVLQLVTHDAGFPDAIGDDAEVLSRDAFLARAMATPLDGVPGDGYAYSNTGFGVLAAVLEVRTGRTYDELLEELLAGTGIGDIGYAGVYDDDRSAASVDGRSVRDASWGGHEASWNLIGNGGLVATPASIVRLRQAVTSGRLLSAEMTAAVDVPYIVEGPGATTSYGFGLVVDELEGAGPYLWHDGGNGVFSAHWADLPERGDVVFVAATDTDAGNATDVIEVLARNLYGR